MIATDGSELERCFSPDQAQRISFVMVMMGFLNTVMNAIGVELEVPTLADVATTIGDDWSSGAAGQGLDPAVLTAPLPADNLTDEAVDHSVDADGAVTRSALAARRAESVVGCGIGHMALGTPSVVPAAQLLCAGRAVRDEPGWLRTSTCLSRSFGVM